MSPTARTLAMLRELGYMAEVVERFVPRVKVRRDLFGFCDVEAVHPDHGFLAVQATTMGNMAARRKKMEANGNVGTWLAAGGKVEIWGWAKRGARGQRKLWTVKRYRFKREA